MVPTYSSLSTGGPSIYRAKTILLGNRNSVRRISAPKQHTSGVILLIGQQLEEGEEPPQHWVCCFSFLELLFGWWLALFVGALLCVVFFLEVLV